MWKNLLRTDDTWGAAVNTEEQRRLAFVELELAAVWQGHERGVVGRLRKVAPEASVYVGFAVAEEPAQELA
jgi:hypothetical protein